MTGIPSSEAFLTAGRIASESIARMTRTFAPLEIRLSTSVNCLVGDPCASAEMYLAPCASSAFLIAASSVFQRSSWKFDHETPTVRSFAIAVSDVRPTDASSAAPNTSVFAVFIVFLHLRSIRDRLKSFFAALSERAVGRRISHFLLDRAPAQLDKSSYKKTRIQGRLSLITISTRIFPARRGSARPGSATKGRALRTSLRGQGPGRRRRP